MHKHKSYWQVVLEEVLNKDDKGYTFLYTSLGQSEDETTTKQNTKKEEPKRARVILDGEFSGLYLTPREVDCLIALSGGQTVKLAAKEMALSHRTVEFYLNNLKAKFGCTTKTELLTLVAEADLLSNLKESKECEE